MVAYQIRTKGLFCQWTEQISIPLKKQPQVKRGNMGNSAQNKGQEVSEGPNTMIVSLSEMG